MGTRGTFGYRKNKQDKLMYNHWDSYPEGLGQEMISYIKKYSTEQMNKVYDNIKFVDDNDNNLYREMERKIHRNEICLSSFHKDSSILMPEYNDFIKDSLYCEWGYIINLDTECLEVWKGFQKQPQKNNRYGTQQNKDNGYYPCKLMIEIPLDDVRKDKVETLNFFLENGDDEE